MNSFRLARFIVSLISSAHGAGYPAMHYLSSSPKEVASTTA